MENSEVINSSIHPEDEMMQFIKKNNLDEEHYFKNGAGDLKFFVDTIKSIRPELLTDPCLLEFGCGHGRIARHIRNYLKPDTFVVSDVWKSGVNFCSTEFDALPFVITDINPISKLDLKFDLILSYSVFSHLEPNSFEYSLSQLRDLIKPGGLLLFTVKGERSARERNISLENGYVFRGGNETNNRLSSKVYAGMFVSQRYVKSVIDKVGLNYIKFIDRGKRQDLYVVDHA